MGTYEGYTIPAFAFEEEQKKAMKRAIKFAEKEKEIKGNEKNNIDFGSKKQEFVDQN